MSYGVALRNGVPFTLGTIAALCVNATSQWSPLALWPDGIDSPGMWIDPSLLTASFNDYTGTTPVATPGTVADSANPVGLALDIRAGAPDTLGPELVTNGDFSDGTTGWTLESYVTSNAVSGGRMRFSGVAPTTNFNYIAFQILSVTAGKTYKISFPLTVVTGGIVVGLYGSGISSSFLGSVTGTQTVYVVATTATLSLTLFAWNGASTDVPFDVTAGPATAKEVPGNHMLQATAAARPLESARVNLLRYTEDFSNAVWDKTNVTLGTLVTAPDGTTTAQRLTINSGFYGPNQTVSFSAEIGFLRNRCYVRSVSGNTALCMTVAPNVGARIDNTFTVTSTWQEFTFSSTIDLSAVSALVYFAQDRNGAGQPTVIEVWHPQVSLGSGTPNYQRVNTDSDYDATGITPWQLYDGTDDGMATASFAAGTFIDGMDCMIAVRRDSAANCVAGLYNGIADATKFFGMAESASGSGCVGSGAGTPTVWVDNTQLTGGTAVTRGTLHTALTAGSYHILEFRNLDLSAWTATGFGLYTSYVFPGARGDIMLFESTASTEDKDKARQYLADKYGVTLA